MTSGYADQYIFGPGILSAKPVGGVTPVRFAVLQDASVKMKAELKRLYGSRRYAIATAPGKTEVMIQAKFAGIRGRALNSILFDGTLTAGTQTLFADQEAGAAPLETVDNAATFVEDWGVTDATSGQPLTGVSSGPTTDQYSVSAGTYTFGTLSSGGTSVLISYTYTTASGLKVSFGNPVMGSGPIISAALSFPYDGRQANWFFPRCVASNFDVPTKIDDFAIQNLDIEVVQGPDGSIGTLETAF